MSETRRGGSRRQRTDGWSFARIAILGAATIGGAVALVSHPPGALLASSSVDPNLVERRTFAPAPTGAFGASGDVRLQLRMPGELFDYPLTLQGAGGRTEYQWLRAEDSLAVVPPRMLLGATVAAPVRAGFYRLAVTQADGRRVVDSILVGVLVPFTAKLRPPLAPPAAAPVRAGFYRLAVTQADGRRVVDSILVGVLVPFTAKLGSTLNGYRIGRWQWERTRDASAQPPRGFVEVRAEDVELPVSTHFRLADLLTHDGQETWPRYLALDPRILDKVELVLRYLGGRDRDISVDLHSGFRPPLSNLRVPRSASDSRHQYGDAADLAIDADGDGRVTDLDGLAVSHAVEVVERAHPELVGGLGLYGNSGAGTYVHIDVRGARKRWRG